MGSPAPYERLLQPPRQSFFLFRMRGVGKSTWARQVFPKARRFDLLDEGLFQSYLRDPRLFGRELMRATKRELHAPGQQERGALLEGWVGGLLRAYGEPGCGLGLRHDGLSYWASVEGGAEVDFLVQRGKEIIAIEVKATETLDSRDLKGLRAIVGLKGLGRRILVFLGDRPHTTEDGIEALPVRDFIDELERQNI